MLTIILIAAGLSMDAFAVAVCKGLAISGYKLKYSLICGAWFGAFQAIMPMAGYILGIRFCDSIKFLDHWIAFALLGLIGFQMIREALNKDTKSADPSFSPKTMAVLAVATSIDALAVGVTFAFLSVNIIIAVLIIGVFAFAISAAGVCAGAMFGARYKGKAEIAGGVILILIAIKILAAG